ncbi:ATP-binding protein PhnN [Rhodovulum sp. P5]|uniref:phosphonate metabolism protein/1,5-bisphosphokinase (PRPP-forming) PhnN n=1 Tax=Rhodovulum sp. P5 TaxID=1564506 RepID=UPI0009C34CE6|nr:phosphonate metabolism protein/1,5-bisphosphokinase (PRPP-forming) PhnN [Rhodovulum sp. P5]ARE38782.1 ATP-binding protein PhnN [Rhodovulum sp. P5]
MTGRLIGIVGPSGVGKDSLMQALADRAPGFGLVRRVITRDPALGGEDFDPVTEEAFEALLRAGRLCLHWRAHGLRYGIPAEVQRRMANGDDMLVNLSRRALTDALDTFPDLVVLNVTARPETLAARLAGRGRETAEDIAARLARADLPIPDGVPYITISNDGPLEETVDRVLAVLNRESAQAHPPQPV